MCRTAVVTGPPPRVLARASEISLDPLDAPALANIKRGPEVVASHQLLPCLNKADRGERTFAFVNPGLPYPFVRVHGSGLGSWDRKDVDLLFRWQPVLKREGSVLSEDFDPNGA